MLEIDLRPRPSAPRRRERPGTRIAAAALSLAAAATAATAAAPPLVLPPGASEAAGHITPTGIRATVSFLADDLLEGRGPGSRGDALARAYLASELAALGLEPAFPAATPDATPDAGASYQQPMAMVGIKAELPPTWTFRGPKGTVEAKALDDFVAASGTQTVATDLPATELVFVGYGIQAPEYQWDDFKGAKLAGKLLVMLNNDPDWDDSLFAGKRRLYYGRWSYKYESALRQGAAGAIIIHTTPSAGYNWGVVRSSWGGEQFELPQTDEPRLRVTGWLTEDAARRVLALSDQNLDQLVAIAARRDFRPVPLGVETSLRFTNTLTQVATANVGGLLRGSDPELAKEVVVYTAHHDHLGIGEADADGDTIYNGARDNGSGVGEILAVAKAFTALPTRPRRSVLFLFVAAEEQGLLGSAYYAAHPTFAPGRIAANVNMDAGGIWGKTRDITYVGYGKSATLDAITEGAAALQGRTVFGDPEPDKGSFYRSDQFNFAKIGVPALYLDNGVDLVGRTKDASHALIQRWEDDHYHQPSDELTPDWDFSGMVEDAQVAFWAGLAIANADQMPTWNPGDEFAAARAAALAAVGAGP